MPSLRIPIFNVAYPYDFYQPTDYRWIQTYPPSIGDIQFRDPDRTIFFQVQIHADSQIREHTPITLGAEASVGVYYKNAGVIGVYLGFFGANWAGPVLVINNYVIWTDFAGTHLQPSNDTSGTTIIYSMGKNGTNFRGPNGTVSFNTDGDKPLSLVLIYRDYHTFNYTYQFATLHVYSSETIRTSQVVLAESVGVFGGVLYGVLEVFPKIGGDSQQEATKPPDEPRTSKNSASSHNQH